MKFDELVRKIDDHVQEYYLPYLDEEQRELVRPGQFVHENNDSDMVVGFISMRSDHGYNICLFDARHIDALPAHARPRSGRQDMDWVAEQLEFALLENPGMRKHWIDAVNGKTVDATS